MVLMIVGVEVVGKMDDKKFEEIYEVTDYEVLTDGGWSDIGAIGKTIKYTVWNLITEHHSLKCADNHIVFRANGNQVFVKDLKPGDKIKTDCGDECVVNVYKEDFDDNMYDLQVESLNHSYYSNGILSHNSTMYCIYALWYTTFFPEKKVMILANKAQTSLELMGRIELAYSYLPSWLKCAVTTYNKGQLEFANKSCVIGFASSSSAARGFTASCVDKDTKVVIRFKWLPFIRFKVKVGFLEKLGNFCAKLRRKPIV
jgi:hypothetical protein